MYVIINCSCRRFDLGNTIIRDYIHFIKQTTERRDLRDCRKYGSHLFEILAYEYTPTQRALRKKHRTEVV